MSKALKAQIEPWTLKKEAWGLKKMELWRVFRPMVADSHHFDGEQDLDPH
jgi:hypothetical protein